MSDSAMTRDHLIVIYLCGECLWNSAVTCEPREPPPPALSCASCAADGRKSNAEPVEGVLASAEDCIRFEELCQSPEPENHREAMHLIQSLRGRYLVAITEWAKTPPRPTDLDTVAFKRRVRDEEGRRSR